MCVCFQCTVLCCKSCSIRIANIRDVFTVTAAETSGPLAIHVNPGGVVSELITVSAVAAVSLNGFPVLHDTWYPGYVVVILHFLSLFCVYCCHSTVSAEDFLGRLLRVDLIKWVSNVRLPVHMSVRPSVRPQKVSLISMKFGMQVEVNE